MPVTALQTREEVLDQLTQISKTATDDFRIKVWLKAKAAAHPELVLGVRGARVEHAAEPETWIPRLIGGSGDGGTFTLEIAHEDAPATTLGKLPDLRIGGASRRDNTGAVRVDWSVLDDPTWSGPINIAHPIRPNAAGPAAPASYLSIARGEGGQPAASVNTPQQAAPYAAPSNAAEDLIQRTAAVRRDEDALKQRQHELELAALQRQHNEERAKAKADLDDLRAELRRGLTAPAAVVAPPVIPGLTELLGAVQTLVAKVGNPPPVAAPTPPPPSVIEKLLTPEGIALVAPLFMGLFGASRETAKETAAATAKMSETILTMQRDSAKDMRDLLLQLKSGDGGTAKFMEMIAGMQAQSITQMSNMLDMQVRMVKELAPPEEKDEPAWKEIIRLGLSFLSENQKQSRQLQRDLAKAALGGAGATSAAAAELPTGAEIAAPLGDAPGDAPEGEEPLPEPEALKRIKMCVREMRPVAEVASLIINSYRNDPEFQKEVHEGYEDNLEELFEDHLGAWLTEDEKTRAPYATALLEAIAKILQAEEKIAFAKGAAAGAAAGATGATATPAAPVPAGEATIKVK